MTAGERNRGSQQPELADETALGPESVRLVLLDGATEGEEPDSPILPLAHQARLAVLEAMQRLAVPSKAQMALVMADDALLHALNRQHRGIDKPTDVLSFRVDARDLPDDEATELGDVIISVPYARRSAHKLGHDLSRELDLLAVHGLLHLLGHEDATDEGAREMRRLERALGVRPDGP